MRLVPKPGGTKQQFRAMLFTMPFDLAWTPPVNLIRLTNEAWSVPTIAKEAWTVPTIANEAWKN